MADPTPSKPPVAVLEYEPTAFESALLRHKPKIILVSALALLGTLAYWGNRLWTDHKQKEAALSFVRAETVADLKSAADAHSSQTAGGNALVLAASLLSADRPGEAVDTLKNFIARFPNHPLRGLAEFRIGDYLLQTPDKDGAARQLEEVASKAGPDAAVYAPLALLRLGDLKWAAGDTEGAKQFYDRILTTPTFASSPVRQEAQDRVDNQIRQTPPTLVEFVPETPPATPGAPNAPADPSAPPALTVPGEISSPSLLGEPAAPSANPAPLDTKGTITSPSLLEEPKPAAAPAAKPEAPKEAAPAPTAETKPAEAPKLAEPAAK
jgi:predicted negative regulator of RcsB-dependent stress response